MARKLNSRETVLLSGLVVASLAYGYIKLVGGSDGSGRSQADDEPGLHGGLAAPVVEMAMLTREPDSYDPNGRDLFKYSKRPETLRERLERERLERERLARLRRQADQKKQADEARRKSTVQVARNTPPPRPKGPTPPQVHFEYLGYLGPKDDRIAVFEDGEEQLLLARAGEVLEEDFMIREIAYQKVIIGYTQDEFKDKTTELKMRDKKQ